MRLCYDCMGKYFNVQDVKLNAKLSIKVDIDIIL